MENATSNKKKKPRKAKYIGTVTNEFKTSNGVHKVGSEYDCKDEFSYNYLKTTNKIK